MFLCADGSYDMSIIGHEYSHAISNRMVNGPNAGIGGAQGGAMGESWGDLFAADLSGVDVVTLFLLTHVNFWLEGKLKRELKPGARVAGYAFPMHDWAPAAEARHGSSALYLWVR